MGRRIGALAALVALATTLAVPAAAQTDPDEYLALVAELETRVATLATQAVEVNDAWDARDVEYRDTLDALRSLEAETAGVTDDLEAVIPPAEFEAQHTALVGTAGEVQTAATAMIAGLQASDTGEARQAALDEFLDSTSRFADLAILLRGPAATTTTSTTSTSTTTTTTTTLAPTTTQAAQPEITVAPAPADDGGSDVETPLLVLIGLLAGLLVGITGGLLVGRSARVKLIEELRRQRGEIAPEEPPTF